MGIRRHGKNTFAGPNAIISAWPEIRRISRYLATEFRLIFISLAISVTVMPFVLFFRIVFIWVSSLWYCSTVAYALESIYAFRFRMALLPCKERKLYIYNNLYINCQALLHGKVVNKKNELTFQPIHNPFISQSHHTIHHYSKVGNFGGAPTWHHFFSHSAQRCPRPPRSF